MKPFESHRTCRARKGGFTLIEILIALTVLVVGLVGILALFPVGISSSKSAVEDSTTSILAESIKSSIIKSFRLGPPQDPNNPTPIQYYHDGVPAGLTFALPASGDLDGTWVPLEATGPAPAGEPVFQVGLDAPGMPNELPAVDATQGEDGDMDINTYSQYYYKFQVTKVTSANVDNLYLVVMYIYRQYNDSAAWVGDSKAPYHSVNNPGGDRNEVVNVFSTMVASN
ncbi:MAG: prepilin-type N-terminal cleavage/methylation domain-containing protein [Planctomycetes bacterium]|nr:prepilin-type N-terminal cleavage/methylation domain-containing protein [Planctomycetota bacterium]